MSIIKTILKEEGKDYHDLSLVTLLAKSVIEIVGIKSRLQGLRIEDSVSKDSLDKALSTLFQVESWLRWAEINYRDVG